MVQRLAHESLPYSRDSRQTCIHPMHAAHAPHHVRVAHAECAHCTFTAILTNQHCNFVHVLHQAESCAVLLQVTKDVILQQAIQAFRSDFQTAMQRTQVSPNHATCCAAAPTR
jgi:hypothetical protein